MRGGVLKGILWHQGEGNNTQERVKGYQEMLIAVIENFRTDLGGEYPFLLGEIGRFKSIQLVNVVIRSIPEKVAGSAVVSSEGLEHIGDKTHFDAESARKLGRRYAREFLRISLPLP